MFKNGGKKIITASIVYFWIMEIANIIGGIVLMCIGKSAFVWAGIALWIVGTVFTCLVSALVQGFGEVVDNSYKNTENAKGNTDLSYSDDLPLL